MLRIGHGNSWFSYCCSNWIGRLLNRMRFMRVVCIISMVIWILIKTCFYHVRSVKCSIIFYFDCKWESQQWTNEFFVSGRWMLDRQSTYHYSLIRCIALLLNIIQSGSANLKYSWPPPWKKKIRNRTKRETTTHVFWLYNNWCVFTIYTLSIRSQYYCKMKNMICEERTFYELYLRKTQSPTQETGAKNRFHLHLIHTLRF